jgi:CTD kinase subunit beta
MFRIMLILVPPQDVTLAALYVSSKMQDTLKKPREILMASYTVRFPEQAAKSKSIVGEIDMDPVVRQETLSSTYH